MRAYLYEFINKCDNIGLVPNEKHIDAYLNSVDRIDLRSKFILYCFWHWEKRRDFERNELILNTL